MGHSLPAGVAEDSYALQRVFKENAPSPRTSIVHNTFTNIYAVRHKDWVLIAHKTGAHTQVPGWLNTEHGYVEHNHAGELYDLRNDLEQKHNLYGSNPSMVRELTALLESIRAKGQVR
ncbi:MAG: hypothetical protein FJ405_01390 [Verrucomicrobia bacterium]|nr:hypothetical protein [Verrucomicrobiota bacterium]